MNIIKKILLFLIEPVRAFGSRSFSNQVVSFFDKHKWLIYVLAFVITLVVMYVYYIAEA